MTTDLPEGSLENSVDIYILLMCMYGICGMYIMCTHTTFVNGCEWKPPYTPSSL